MAADKDATALIIGGGIAGLMAGIAMRRYGVDSLVFEQADDLRKTQVGSGLSLGYNVGRTFRHLDLLDEMMEVAAPITHFEFYDAKGKHLGSTPELEGEILSGVIRPVFHQLLVDLLGQDEVQVGAKLVRFEQDSEGVTAHFADGRTARGDVLIGADGLRSVVRAQLLGDSPPRYAGYCTRRGVVESETAKDGVMLTILGRGQRFKAYPVGKWWVYWTASSNEPAGGKETPDVIRRTVLERFQGWPDPVEALVEATDEANLFFGDTYDRDPVERWGEGRVTLLGDSAHPMTWNRGQGASQGIEGAVLLAKELAEGRDDPESALRAWEAKRIPNANKVVKSARQVGKSEQADKAPVVFIRNRLIRILTTGPLFRFANRDQWVEF